ncbi:MAG: bifunctional proline dehydrogenase/L-glutamate gamma-semialdehyde dehydrogenase PutA [Pseudomonadota bacterium]
MTIHDPKITPLGALRDAVRKAHSADEATVVRKLQDDAPIGVRLRESARDRAIALVSDIRAEKRHGLMEVFLAEYGLSTDEGIALMCLAEALLRVPDAPTIDALIEDKIAPSAWGRHLGQSASSLVNASTWALLLTGKVLQDGEGVAATLRSALRRLGEPVIRSAVGRAMKELGAQFVLGETIRDAIARGAGARDQGYSFSYDMLGEAAMTAADAKSYLAAYRDAIAEIAAQSEGADIRDNPGISIKLSALHPRYAYDQKRRVMKELTPHILALARQAKAAGIGLNIDAEEADRLELSLDVIETVLGDPSLAGWDGFGVVVQAYSKRAGPVIDWLYALAAGLDRKIMVRLVKGAYWDTEIKRAQAEGLTGFPVFTQKAATDMSYLCCAKKLLGYAGRIYPQFATHNAHTVSTILELAGDRSDFEFQRLHGMGASLFDTVMARSQVRCRIYAPVGAHRDLLAYLVRRLLENGANSSFVNQIVDRSVPADKICADPFTTYVPGMKAVKAPSEIFTPGRQNSFGRDLRDVSEIEVVLAARAPYRAQSWQAGPIAVRPSTGGKRVDVVNPALPDDYVGSVLQASAEDVANALAESQPWTDAADLRAKVLLNAADLYENDFGALFALLAREAGKTLPDAQAELREAVDFLRYYANGALELSRPALGRVACISPWNFPLAIFTGQVAAALAAGNAVLAKPAEQTGLIAARAVDLLHRAGVPRAALQFMPGAGGEIGARLVSDPQTNGVCFTGSTATAQSINRAMAAHGDPNAPLIAETGGLNAMVVDSTALPEQAVRDIIESAFRSAGQRCSALRVLYVQEDVADALLDRLFGAMDELNISNPWDLSADLGPVISSSAQSSISEYLGIAAREGRLLKQCQVPESGNFVAPSVVSIGSIADLDEEIFGPILHVARYKSDNLEGVVSEINGAGFGLTFGVHSRIDRKVEQLTATVRAGNIYVNRNQIGAIVGSQPFGGEGLSGTGPKAGGPHYLERFTRGKVEEIELTSGTVLPLERLQAAIDAATDASLRPLSVAELPGPTGESNVLSTYGRGKILCMGPTLSAALEQEKIVASHGCAAVVAAPDADGHGRIDGVVDVDHLTSLQGIAGVAFWGDAEALRAARRALSQRDGALIPLFSERDFGSGCLLERHVCIDTTAAGGNARLLAEVG